MKSADRTLRLFEGYAELGRPCTLSELARFLEIPVSSCSGLLKTLEERGYLRAAEPRGTWFPTNRLLQVARNIADHDPLTARVSPLLEKLRDETGESVVLAKRRDTRVVYLDVVESRSTIRYVANVGDLRPLHASSLGRAILSRMPDDERAALLGRLTFDRLTAKTLSSARALEAAVQAGRERGWYENFGESVSDLYAIARPITVDGNHYAIAVIGPSRRIEENQRRHAAALERVCKSLERR